MLELAAVQHASTRVWMRYRMQYGVDGAPSPARGGPQGPQ
jgi:hypothetical protein